EVLKDAVVQFHRIHTECDVAENGTMLEDMLAVDKIQAFSEQAVLRSNLRFDHRMRWKDAVSQFTGLVRAEDVYAALCVKRATAESGPRQFDLDTRWLT